MNTKVLFAVMLIAVFTMGYYADNTVAFAQYMGNVGSQGETGKYTLEEALELQRRRIELVEQYPDAGSGTPVMSADGVFGAAAISAAVFGGIAGALFLKGRQGKYAAMGRG
ncbi:hypothetical protein HX860_05225 [Marine Group I thaumarchaeote]|jgi:hypothetical protein|uniref:Uncharacterized protein n=1 Tax=Marine Group I thaumarchaeote TaxID=2511932 RepID=A0A7K4P6L8_9ARCH|nr:MAG: hypothetical protein DSN69_02005 [Nitrosopumilus sp. YT1]NMI82230.1 hypothetical protein [Candidatus Nitrosopumilus sp. MTA1]NWJ20452.1 hypothetical protein [Marine Group I thaumarchaeote]NWJ28316.1 hypothetical protein [Marine Group I thaumarchaeote]NWJ29497.1 hypothetical protein [Marine Group I thaumarchaeote]